MYSDAKRRPIKKKLKSVIVCPANYQSVRWANSSCNFSEAELDDITCGLERLQMVIMNKAVAISPLVHETTLGPKAETNFLTSNAVYLKLDESSRNIHHSQENTDKPGGAKQGNPNQIYLESHTYSETTRRNDKLLNELEQERQRLLKKSINDRLNVTIKSYKAAQDSRSAPSNLHEKLDVHRALQDAEDSAVEECLRKRGELLAQRQRQQYEKEKAALFAEKVKREEEDKRILIDFQLHEKDFRQRYQSLSENLMCCADKQALLASNSSSFSTIKLLDDGMTQLTAQFSAGEMNHLGLQKASAIIRQFETYSKILQEEAKKINKNVYDSEQLEKEKIAHQQREKDARELQEKEAAAAAAAATVAAAAAKAEEAAQQQRSLPAEQPKAIEHLSPPSTQPALGDGPQKAHLGYLEGCVDATSYQTYKALKMYLAEFQASFAQLSHDPQYKDFTFSCKKAVNIPVNAIGDQSGEHLLDKFQRLSTLLKGGTVHLSDVPFRATAHPQGIHFCMDLLASKLVEQGKTTVSSRGETAFPVAAIIVALWVEIPTFGQVIRAHFFKACPYLVPIFFPQVEGQSDEEYWKSRGYQVENGRSEKEATFVKKMRGIMQLYAAVIVTGVRRQQRAPHPLGLAEGWRWVSCMVNIAPQPAISATLLLTFLEVAGNAMFATYQHQFQKVLHLICKDYLSKMKETDTPGTGGYVSRLEIFLHNMLKVGGIAPPKGALPPHFW